MDPGNLIKGRTLEGLLRTLFECARYHVVELGVEHQLPAVDRLSKDEYVEHLPLGLRLLPDLMIYRWDHGIPKIFFVEAKFRRRLTGEGVTHLKSKLSRQRKHWPRVFCVLALSAPPLAYQTERDLHQRYIRVFNADELHTLPDDPQEFWGKGKSLPTIFTELSSYGEQNPLAGAEGFPYENILEPLLDASVSILKSLGK